MQKKPESLTFERFSELITGANRDNSPSIYLSKDLSVVTESLLMARVMLGKNLLIQLQDYRCGYVVSGRLRVRINLLERELRAGMLVFITPGSFVQPQSASDDFAFCGMAVSSELVHFAFNNRLPSLFNEQTLDGQLPISTTEADILLRLLGVLKDVAARQQPYHPSTLNLVAAILNLFDGFFAPHLSAQSREKSNDRNIFDRFIYLVNNHCKSEHQMKFYADRMCLTERYLGTVVKKASGLTAKEWIDRAIVTTAKLMLRHDNLTAVEIADRLHFPNASFFSKYFKRLTGLTPLEYRRK